MKHDSASDNQNARRTVPIACSTALAVVVAVMPVGLAHAERVRPPRVPAEIRAPAGNKAFLEGHAVGTQDYICLPSGSGFVWTFFAPQATLFNDDRKQVITHFLSPNPFEGDTPRATWQHSRDTSAVWGLAIQTSSNPRFVRNGAIPWLLLQVVGGQDGPTQGGTLTSATYIQRLNTRGGVAPSTGCAESADVGKKMLVPYEADYFFYKYDGDSDDND